MTKHSLIKWLVVVALVAGGVVSLARVETMRERLARITRRRDLTTRRDPIKPTFSQQRIAARDAVRTGRDNFVMPGVNDFSGQQAHAPQPAAQQAQAANVQRLENEVKALEQKVAALELVIHPGITDLLSTFGYETDAKSPMVLKQGLGGSIFWGSGNNLSCDDDTETYMVWQITDADDCSQGWDWVRAH